MMEWLTALGRSPAYTLFVIFVVMPMNGVLIKNGPWWMRLLGVVLLGMQIPWALDLIKRATG